MKKIISVIFICLLSGNVSANKNWNLYQCTNGEFAGLTIGIGANKEFLITSKDTNRHTVSEKIFFYGYYQKDKEVLIVNDAFHLIQLKFKLKNDKIIAYRCFESLNNSVFHLIGTKPYEGYTEQMNKGCSLYKIDENQIKTLSAEEIHQSFNSINLHALGGMRAFELKIHNTEYEFLFSGKLLLKGYVRLKGNSLKLQNPLGEKDFIFTIVNSFVIKSEQFYIQPPCYFIQNGKTTTVIFINSPGEEIVQENFD